jgi:hypothetical protein
MCFTLSTTNDGNSSEPPIAKDAIKLHKVVEGASGVEEEGVR